MKIWNRLIAAIVLVALIGGLFTLGQRYMDDRNNRTVQVAMDFRDLYARQDLWQVPLDTYLGELKERGLQAVVLQESTVEEMVRRGMVSVVSGLDMLELKQISTVNVSDLPTPVEQFSYVFSDDLAVLVRLQAELVRRYGEPRVQALSMSEPWGMAVQVSRNSLMAQRVGFLLEDLETIRESGLDILPILYNYGRIGANRFEEVLRELEIYGEVHSIIFDGASVVGFPSHIQQTALSMNYRNMVMGMIQPADTLLGHVPVAGTEQLLEEVFYRGARTYMVSRGMTNNISTRDMVSRWINSIREYNVHILYLRPFHAGSQGESAAQRNLTYVDTLAQQIYAAGYETGPAPTFPEINTPHPLLRGLLMWGIGAAALMLLQRLRQIPWQLMASGLAVLGLLAAVSAYVPRLLVLQWGWALGGAILFPLLAMTMLMQNEAAGETDDPQPVWQWALLRFLETTLVTVCGTVIVAALITTPRFILDVDYFRGVKVSYIIPVMLIVLVYYWFSYFSKERDSNISRELKAWIRRPLTVGDLMLGGCIVGFLGFYILRSGNMEIPALEVTLRDFLDRVLVVRPRTKEFLVGHPFLILAAAAALKGHRRLLVLFFSLGSIGQISIMNTFMHIRTPLVESVLRTANGLWLGALVGMAFIWIWNRGQAWLEKKDPDSSGTDGVAEETGGS